MNKLINTRIKHKYGTSIDWSTKNPILFAGELGIESDTNKFKIGDGNTEWNLLPYVIPTKVSELENDSNFLTEHQSLDNYVTKEDLPDLTGLATEAWVTEQLNEVIKDLNDAIKDNENNVPKEPITTNYEYTYDGDRENEDRTWVYNLS